jgi:hypothetical protein
MIVHFLILLFLKVETKSKLSPANSYQELTLLDDNQKPWLVAIR